MPDGKKVAVVGARNCTVQGQTIAKYFGKELARAGVCVVSGMALGIDGAAHRGALDARMETGNPEQAGGTIGVLGCGINVRYPLEHYHLFDEMEANGTLLSEYNWNVRPNRGFFPARNQIMSAMCDAILVVEARRRSGSLITADMGLEQGKDIFAVPGRITDELSVGCNRLIQQGASVATCPAEILAQLGIRTEPADESGTKTDAKNFSLETDEKLVYSCLDFEPKYVDSIIRETGLSVQTVLSILYQLESRRCVRQVVNNYYAKTESELR